MPLLYWMSTVIFTTDHSDVHSGKVLRPPTLHQHHVVLLERVPLARDERNQLLPVAEADATTLAVGRVGLLWFPYHSLEDDALHLGPTAHGPRRLGPSLHWTFPHDLVHRPVTGWGGVEPSHGSWDESSSYLPPCVSDRSCPERTQKPPDNISRQHDEGRSSHVGQRMRINP